MALHLIRTTQSAEFVHINDDAAKLPAEGQQWPGPSDRWLSATGQPEACTRFRVRCLSADEVAECSALVAPAGASDDDAQAARRRRQARICELGWLALDGAPPPQDVGFGWHHEVSTLIEEVTVAGPLGRRR